MPEGRKSIFSSENRNDGSPLCINGSGYQRENPVGVHTCRPNGRVDYQLIYIINGRGIFQIGSTVQEVGGGHMVLYKPGEPQIYQYRSEDDAEYYWVHMNGGMMDQYLHETGLADKKVFYIGQAGECVEQYQNILRELRLKRPGYHQLCKSYFLALVVHVSRRIEGMWRGCSREKYERIADIMDFIYDNFNDQSTVSDYAARCNLNKFRFIHNFKDITGTTPNAYKNHVRIEKAKEYLRHTMLNITEIAELTGFESVSYFARLFKKSEGVSPRTYQRSRPLPEIALPGGFLSASEKQGDDKLYQKPVKNP